MAPLCVILDPVDAPSAHGSVLPAVAGVRHRGLAGLCDIIVDAVGSISMTNARNLHY